MRYLLNSIIITSLIISSCKEENTIRWTDIDINITSLTTDDYPDSIHFKVLGHKSGDGYLTKSDGSIEIDDYIINGNYQGGFLAKTSSRWQYDLILEESLSDSFYIKPESPDYIDLEKRKFNKFDFQVGKKHAVNIKTYLSSWTDIGDGVKVLFKHSQYDTQIDISQNSEDWNDGGKNYIHLYGIDTLTTTKHYPAGIYNVGVKTFVSGEETGYFYFEYEVYSDSTNLLELYY